MLLNIYKVIYCEKKEIKRVFKQHSTVFTNQGLLETKRKQINNM